MSTSRAAAGAARAPRSTTGSAETALAITPERALDRRRRALVDPAATMKIGEVHERLGLSLRSIRYYEEEGLVTPTARTSGGFRLYSELDVQRLILVMQMKPLGFSLDEMRQVLADLVLLDGDAAPAEAEAARARLLDVTHDVEARWASLQQRLEIATMFREHLDRELGLDAAD